MAKKILVTEKVAEECVRILRDKGFEVDVSLKTPPERLLEIIPDYDALIVRSATKVTREVVEAGAKLKVIGRAGVGVDNIDIPAATDRGVIVCNAPTSNIVSAAEHAFALMLTVARNIPQANAFMKSGQWARHRFKGVELYEKTLAIFGLGRIGGLMAERARAFGMKVVGYDPYCAPERADALGVTLYDRLEDILPIADFITVHMPKTNETIGMFGPDEMALMKDGVILVNAARGGIFQEKALADFLAAGKIRAVGMDMFENEPCTDSPLHEFDQAVLTPHIAAVTEEAQRRAGVQIANYVAAGLAGSIVPTAINMAPVPPEVMDAVGPYVPACQLMGSVLAQIDREVPKSLKVDLQGGLISSDPSILVAGTLKGLLTYHSTTTVTPVNAAAVAKRHGIKVETTGSREAGGYSTAVSVTADGAEIACTMVDATEKPRLISLFGYKMDIAPGTQSLIFEYVDAPGRVGTIGTILGEHDINITTMQIGTKPEERCALVYMNVEGDVTDDVLEKLRGALPDLKNLWSVKL